MTGEPLVSIVTPCFNSVRFIRGCIESVLAQDYPHVEHIVQDGASTDGTVEILREYTGRVDWVSAPDKGQADGLDRVLKRCRGDIILVLNADDMLLPHAASWGVENMARYTDVAVIYGDELIIDEEGKVINVSQGPKPYNFHKLLCVEQVPPAQAAFIRRAHFEQVGIGTDPDLATCPDYEMWARLGLKFPMAHIPGFVSKYRWHQSSEGRQIAVIKQMVEAKRLVMDRVFDNPATPRDIRSLRRRAHAGLSLWAAKMQANIASDNKSDTVSGIRFTLKGILLHPSKQNIHTGSNLFVFFSRRLGRLATLAINSVVTFFRLGRLPVKFVSTEKTVSDKVLAAAGLALLGAGTCGLIAAFIIFDASNNNWKQWVLSYWLLSISGFAILFIRMYRRLR